MKALVAWRILAHEKGRSVLAIGGIFIAILLMFLQLGFYVSVPNGGMTIYDALKFDILLASTDYVFQGQSGEIPRRRLYQAMALPEVAHVAAFYQGSGRWVSDRSPVERDVFVMGVDPHDRVFDVPDIDRQLDRLPQPDTILVDRSTRPEFGAIEAGRVVEIEQRAVRIGGAYSLGTGFVGLGAAVVSDINFLRLFPTRAMSQVNLGLATLKPGADPNRTAARLREILPADTQVLTRDELVAHERSHWMTRTSTGLVFGFGVIVAFVVGLVILNQTLSTQILRQLSQYATLKAIGYTDRYLSGIVVTLAMIMSGIGYIPAVAFALVIYAIIRNVTVLPVAMTESRLISVLAITLVMSAASALFALRVLRRADPMDLFTA
jgi:heterocyst specific transport system permease protein